MELRLDNKVAVVTGAGRGVGAAVAQRLAAAGARVAVNDINPDRAERTAVAIREAGGQAIAVAADVANKYQCAHLIERTRAEWGRLDILVNNAAVHPAKPIMKLDEWEWQRTLDVNLKGTFFMSQLAGRVMAGIFDKRAGVAEATGEGGVIVNIASTAGVETALADGAAYCASMGGVVGFARECAREFAQYGIRVNTILPTAHNAPQPQKIADRVLSLCVTNRKSPSQ
jgi:NAD(P)-dependent dehydrogenase (short-subunit alcohol dehydrogenase family)